jgi:predicted ArsR family transcriptional regulator
MDLPKGILEISRRQFFTRVMPACAVTCLGAGKLAGFSAPEWGSQAQEGKHKFDNIFDRPLTYRQFFGVRYGEFIRLAKSLEKEMGREKLLDFLMKDTQARGIQIGQQQAKRSPDTSFETYVKTFKDPSYDKTLTKQVIEDTDTAFELKVTECIWASVFLQAKAGDIGYATVCYGDYSWAEGFNPKIKLIRDKTLMQGHEYCNHRYVWEG